jgi:hypothetical protein
VVFSLVYSSTTDHDWSQDELVGLLRWSRGWNVRHGITGILLYRDCAFMQMLEGEEDAVRGLFSSISVDRRHQDVNLMWTDQAELRRFADWSMAFRELGEHPVLHPGYSTALNEPTGRRSARRANALDDFLSVFRPG